MWSWETLLSNLPTLLTMWSALVVSWGAFTTITYYKLVCHTEEYECDHSCYNANFIAMVAANCFIFAYLTFGSRLMHNVGDAIAVVNTFYMFYLIPLTICVYKTWRRKIDNQQEIEPA